MSASSSLSDRLSGHILAKLGACPRCMRTSALITLVAWALVLLSQPWPFHWAVPSVLLTVAVAVTLLLLTHVIAYSLRVTAAKADSNALTGAGGRRGFLKQAVRAGIGALLVSLLPRAVYAQVKACKPKQTIAATNVCGNPMKTRKEAEDDLKTAARVYCRSLCANFDSDCNDPHAKCTQTRLPSTTAAPRGADVVNVRCTRNKATGEWTCCGDVVVCNCVCDAQIR